MQLLIMFYLETDLMNHFIFSEFTGVFLFILDYMITILQFFKILIFMFSYYLFYPCHP